MLFRSRRSVVQSRCTISTGGGDAGFFPLTPRATHDYLYRESMRSHRGYFIFLSVISVSICASRARADLTFERDVRPILKTHCFHCHGEDGKPKGGVDLRLRRFMLKELDEGVHVMAPGQPEQSEILRLVRAGEMPKKGKKLTVAEIETIERWIAARTLSRWRAASSPRLSRN